MEEDPPEVGHQAVDVHQRVALEVVLDGPQLEAQAVNVLQQAQAQEVDQLEVLEVDRQVEVGLEMVLEVLEVAQVLLGAYTSTHLLTPTIKQWQKLPRVSQVPQPPAWHKVQDAAEVVRTTLDSLTSARLCLAAQEV
jgi:hypothetical protein